MQKFLPQDAKNFQKYKFTHLKSQGKFTANAYNQAKLKSNHFKFNQPGLETSISKKVYKRRPNFNFSLFFQTIQKQIKV